MTKTTSLQNSMDQKWLEKWKKELAESFPKLKIGEIGFFDEEKIERIDRFRYKLSGGTFVYLKKDLIQRAEDKRWG